MKILLLVLIISLQGKFIQPDLVAKRKSLFKIEKKNNKIRKLLLTNPFPQLFQHSSPLERNLSKWEYSPDDFAVK